MPSAVARPVILDRAGITGRMRSIRREVFGEGDVSQLARQVGVPERTWLNYESGVTIPGEVLLRFLDLTSAEPRWLLTGQGPRYRAGSMAETPH